MDNDFETLTNPYQHELLVHCYRMLGSRLDAEEALQETMLKAWRKWDTLQSQSSLRAWLYRIATNTCLDSIAARKRLFAVPFSGSPADPLAPLPAPTDEADWLEPLPDKVLLDEVLWDKVLSDEVLSDEALDAHIPGPAARYETRESVNLAFLALLQKLPGHQRAVLILRDVLGWKADETAKLLELSTAAVNSSLQRARTAFNQAPPDWSNTLRPPASGDQAARLLARYQQAWEAADAASLASLLTTDVRLSMPPLPVWFSGREAIITFYREQLFKGHAAGFFHLLPAHANGCPAFAIYEISPRRAGLPTGLQVLSVEAGGIARIDSFIKTDPGFYNSFGLPSSLTD